MKSANLQQTKSDNKLLTNFRVSRHDLSLRMLSFEVEELGERDRPQVGDSVSLELEVLAVPLISGLW